MVMRWITFLLFAIISVPTQAATCTVPAPPLPACQQPEGCVVNIRNAATGEPDPRLVLMLAVGQDNTTVRLAPDLDLDFSSLPSCLFPIDFGRKVTLTSVASFAPAGVSSPRGSRRGERTGAAVARTAVASVRSQVVGDLPDRVNEVPQEIGQARSPRALGPVLRYGKHRTDRKVAAFFEIRCFPGVIKDGSRVSGFRLYGPSFEQQETSEAGILIDRCSDIEVSNMEIAGWGGAGVVIQDAADESGFGDRLLGPSQIRIVGNFFHHNQFPTECGSLVESAAGAVGLTDCRAGGYGVDVGHSAWAKISANVFDFNRHAIATPGDVGGYHADRNLVLRGGGYHGATFHEHTHQFDVHGDGCWWSSDLCGNAGRQFWFYRNAFQYRNGHAIKIRGRPDIAALIDDNVFPHDELKDDAVHLQTTENVRLGDRNVLDVDTFGQYGVCDFDGDGVDDLFLATGKSWWYSSYGEFHWSYMSDRAETLNQLRLGYFDNDARCDVLAYQQGKWVLSSGGYGDWQPFGAFAEPLAHVKFGRFGGNASSTGTLCGVVDHRHGATGNLRTTHAFKREDDGQWYVRALDDTRAGWEAVQSSGLSWDELAFGDFSGDGNTDVLAVVGGRWSISESGRCPWRQINRSLGDAVSPLWIANIDPDDAIDDVLRLDKQYDPLGGNRMRATLVWWRSKNGTGAWQQYKSYTFDFSASDATAPGLGFAGRFGLAPGGATMVIDQDRKGHFFAPAEAQYGRNPEWMSIFSY